jgi:limonene-1,2-epoxide hydrolase
MAESAEIQVVRAFLGALEAQDLDAALELSDPGIVYQNVPLPPARGRDAFAKQMRAFVRYFSGFEARINAVAAADDGVTVLTERVDVLTRGRLRTEFWVCGTFEVRDGRVVLWRDYFDYVNVTAALVRGTGRAVAGAIADRRKA